MEDLNKGILIRNNYLCNSRTKYILGFIILVLVEIVYSSNYFNNTFPLSEGWFIYYAELMQQGKVPYKDFYYFLPPLNILVDWVFWKLSFGYWIIYRAWYLVERISIYLLMYNLLCRYFDWKKVVFACAVSEVLCTADVFDFFGDYNQNIVFLTVILVYCAVNYIESTEIKRKCKALLVAGVVLGLMFLCKQTIILAATIFYFGLLLIICISKRDYNLWRYIIATILGLIVPITICGIILFSKGALLPFIDQVFISVDGKGSIWDIILAGPLETHKNWVCWAIALAIFGLIKMVGTENSEDKKKQDCRVLLVAIIGILLINNIGIDRIIGYIKSLFASKTGTILITCYIIVVLLILLKRKKIKNYHLCMRILGLIGGCSICFWAMISKAFYNAIYDLNLFGTIPIVINNTIYYFCIIYLIYCVMQMIKNNNTDKRQEAIMMILCGGIALGYAASMAAGSTTIPSLAMRVCMPIGMTLFMSIESNAGKSMMFFKRMLVAMCVVMITVCIAHKSISPYPWWGMIDKPKNEKIYSTNLRMFSGLQFSEEDKELYEQVTLLIEENTEKDDIIFGFPYIKIFHLLTERYNDYFVPIVWYDVVSDKYVKDMLEEIEDNPPKMILWKDIPNALEVHEDIYRNGKPLEQRKLIALLEEMMLNSYECLGEYNSVKVYLRVD